MKPTEPPGDCHQEGLTRSACCQRSGVHVSGQGPIPMGEWDPHLLVWHAYHRAGRWGEVSAVPLGAFTLSAQSWRLPIGGREGQKAEDGFSGSRTCGPGRVVQAPPFLGSLHVWRRGAERPVLRPAGSWALRPCGALFPDDGFGSHALHCSLPVNRPDCVQNRS